MERVLDLYVYCSLHFTQVGQCDTFMTAPTADVNVYELYKALFQHFSLCFFYVSNRHYSDGVLLFCQ